MVIVAVAGLNQVRIWLPSPLTHVEQAARQRKIAALVAAGMSNKSIAQKPNISVRTMDTRIGHTFQRLGVARPSEPAVVLSAVWE
ncbi:LuxR C-terminal-related transcriptional regulator [Arthrobacter sp. H35-D1]|uniref:LuxR C-terminal-related transcriptional regulator n=1 Tax=Arthrobacter sp. H35-D1 TaxID=3046202 RepID=UPI0024B9C0D4|nr:LuxR C-terminal-related transcriptional regulator [Arthrobacter sp. H35-D1]MDJ0313283.1 LuxR C-terminal-related transcriptional regulator [Arthrobacter sp. H35-D1]